MKNSYDDIIHLPHHVSATHPHMPIADRAAQFSPFAALTGHNEAIKETARLTDQKIELGEDEQLALEQRLNILADTDTDYPEVSVTYFKLDEKKSGGSYVTVVGQVKKIDDYERIIVMMDGINIPIEDIMKIKSELFEG